MASWSWVRASTAWSDHAGSILGAVEQRGGDASASAASSSKAVTTGMGPSAATERGGAVTVRPRAAVAAATTWGVDRWFSSSRTTSMPSMTWGSRASRVGSAPFHP